MVSSLPGPKGFAFSLANIQWEVFATLTFRTLSTERRRWQLAWSHLQDLARSLEVPYGELLIALRSEHGELGGRPHFHYLLGGTGAKSSLSLAFFLRYDWRCRVNSGAVVRPYERRLAGADYVEKCLSGANQYELKKFNTADLLELSSSVKRQIQRSRRSIEHTESVSAGVQRGAVLNGARQSSNGMLVDDNCLESSGSELGRTGMIRSVDRLLMASKA
jgi:hypothetical protein